MADGLFYNDTKAPFITADISPVTLATTDKALYPVSNFPVLGGQYWNYAGKKMKIRLFGKMTTAATPGNGTWDIYYGSGADANGTVLASSAAVALVANGSSLSWMMECYISCRTTGSAGGLFVDGIAWYNVGLTLSTAAPVLIPASSAVVAGSLDLTAANIISVQYKRSGNTAETMAVQDMEVIAMN